MTKSKDVQIIALKCPNCGGALQVPEGTNTTYCEHCHTSVLIVDAAAGRTPADTRAAATLSEAARKRVLKIVLWGTAISVGLPILTTVLVFIILAVVFLVIGLGFLGSGR